MFLYKTDRLSSYYGDETHLLADNGVKNIANSVFGKFIKETHNLSKEIFIQKITETIHFIFSRGLSSTSTFIRGKSIEIWEDSKFFFEKHVPEIVENVNKHGQYYFCPEEYREKLIQFRKNKLLAEPDRVFDLHIIFEPWTNNSFIEVDDLTLVKFIKSKPRDYFVKKHNTVKNANFVLSDKEPVGLTQRILRLDSEINGVAEWLTVQF